MIPIGRTPPERGGPVRGAADTAGVTEQRWVAEVGEDTAHWLATESRTARLALSARALGASRELGEEEDGYITEDSEGLRIWMGEEAYELELEE